MSEKIRSAFFSVLLVLVCSTTSQTANAQQPVDQARNLFLQAISAYQQNNYAIARDLFAKAYAITNYSNYTFYIGHTYDMEGNYGSAFYAYTDYLRDEPYGQYADVARMRIQLIQNPRKVTKVVSKLGKADNAMPLCSEFNPCEQVVEFIVQPSHKYSWNPGYHDPFTPIPYR